MDYKELIRTRLEALVATEKSKSAFAEKCGVSRQNLNAWLSGEATPSAAKLMDIADAYGMTIDALMGRPEGGAVEVTGDAAILVEYFSRLSTEDKQTVIRLAARLGN